MTWMAEINQLGTVLLAGSLGAIVGLERELARKAAGLRTHVFVSAGSALLVLLSDSIVNSFASVSGEQISADPIRIVQAIVIGISFLGAGTIVHEHGREIEGLTTAGSIYMTAGVGIAVAVGEPILALGTAILSVIVLWLIGRIELGLEARRKKPAAEHDENPPIQAETAARASQ